MRLTLAGWCLYHCLVCLLPEFLILKRNVPFYFGDVLLIIVVGRWTSCPRFRLYVMSHQQ